MKKLYELHFVLLVTLVTRTASQELTFTNPIFSGDSSDPHVLKLGDYYYLTLSDKARTQMMVYKSRILTSFRNVENKVVYRAPVGYKNVMAGEMHHINGNLFIYFSMKTATSLCRMYVIKADNASDPMGEWGQACRLLDDWDHSALVGTIMKHNAQLYFVWSAVIEPGPESIYIAPMTSPTWIGNNKMLLRKPKEEWECRGYCASDAPYFIYNENVTYMVFSAGSFSSPDYSLSYMSINEGADPMNVDNWKSINESIFWRNDDEDVYTTGHASFTVSPDENETWMVYHAKMKPSASGHRTARLEIIKWNEDKTPRFPRPHGYDQPQPVPSGQTSTCP